jgi:hypothetical protein
MRVAGITATDIFIPMIIATYFPHRRIALCCLTAKDQYIQQSILACEALLYYCGIILYLRLLPIVSVTAGLPEFPALLHYYCFITLVSEKD